MAGDKIGQVDKGSVLTLTGQKDGWYSINYNGKIGWVSGQYIKVKQNDVTYTVTIKSLSESEKDLLEGYLNQKNIMFTVFQEGD